MDIFKTEAEAERLRPKPDRNYIRRLLNYADNQKPLSISVFKDTGRLVTRQEYQKWFKDVQLHKDCVAVMCYIGGLKIEMLENGRWYLDYGRKDQMETEDFKMLENDLYYTTYKMLGV